MSETEKEWKLPKNTRQIGEEIGKIEAIAKAYVEQQPTMRMEEAITKAWEDHPELMDEYEKETMY